MRYEAYKQWVEQVAAAALPAASRVFALDTIRLLCESTAGAVEAELDDSERRLLKAALAEAEATTLAGDENAIQPLADSVCHDENRYIENYELLSALYDWDRYRRSLNPHYIALIAMHIGNFIDRQSETDIHNIFTSPKMVQEFDRQKTLLGAG